MRFLILFVIVTLPPCLGAISQALPVPPLSAYVDTESSTNMFFDAGESSDRLLHLSLELNATTNNTVALSFGTDADGDGLLDRSEADTVIGWDSGFWFYRDRIADVEVHEARESGHLRLDWTLTLNPNREAKSVQATDANGIVFTGAIPTTMFNPGWNLMKVTACGLTEPSACVVGDVSGWGFNVIVR